MKIVDSRDSMDSHNMHMVNHNNHKVMANLVVAMELHNHTQELLGVMLHRLEAIQVEHLAMEHQVMHLLNQVRILCIVSHFIAKIAHTEFRIVSRKFKVHCFLNIK